MKANLTLSEFGERLRSVDSFYVAAHVNADTDALGSAAGMTLLLRSLGKIADLIQCEEIQPRQKAVLGEMDILFAPPSVSEKRDVLLILDTATSSRVCGGIEKLSPAGAEVWCLDHHISNEGWAQVNCVVPEATSTAELVGRLAKLLRAPSDKIRSSYLFAGIMDDTGCFRYGPVTGDVLRVAADLLDQGIELLPLTTALYFETPASHIRLRGLALSRFELMFDGRVALLALTAKDLEECGVSVESADFIVDDIRSVEGVQVGVTLRESPVEWRVSFRSKNPEISVNDIASLLGGGGHRAAAACRIRGTKDQVVDKVIASLKTVFP